MRCSICKKTATYFDEYKSPSEIFNRKHIFECHHCGFFFGDLTQPELDEYYYRQYDASHRKNVFELPSPQRYFGNEQTHFKRSRSLIHTKLIYKLLINRNKSKLNIIDFGAGFGTTLFYLKERFEDSTIWAYENSELCEPYLAYIGANVLKGNPECTLSSSNQRFNCIIMSHFLEHLSPYSYMKFISSLIDSAEKDAILLIEVPNDDWARFPERKHTTEPHALFFSEQSLRKIFGNAFEIKSLRPYGWYSSRNRPSIQMRLLMRARGVFTGVPYFADGASLLLVAKKS